MKDPAGEDVESESFRGLQQFKYCWCYSEISVSVYHSNLNSWRLSPDKTGWPCRGKTLPLHSNNSYTFTMTHILEIQKKKTTRSNCLGCTCKTPAQDRYVMLALSCSRIFTSFLLIIFRAQRRLRAKVDRPKVVTQNVCVILFGYLSVFGLSVLFRPASRFRRASISFRSDASDVKRLKAAALGVRSRFHFGQRFTEPPLALSSWQHPLTTKRAP